MLYYIILTPQPKSCCIQWRRNNSSTKISPSHGQEFSSQVRNSKREMIQNPDALVYPELTSVHLMLTDYF